MSGFPRRLRYPAGERPYGEVGRVVKVRVNAFEIESLPSKPFHIYDVIIAGTTELTGRHENADAKRLNVRRASEIIDRLQTRIEPATFNPRAAYDGNKLLYSTTNLGGSRKFEVNMSDQRHADPNSKKGVFTVKLTLARKFEPRQWINQLITSRSTDNDQEHIAAVNFLQVLLRQVPMHHTLGKAYNARSVFTSHASREVKDLPLDLWRGYFQSVRPAVNRMLVNVDITAAVMYREQRVDSWALEFLREGHNSRALAQLTPGTPNYKRIKTALKNIRVFTTTPQNMRSRPIRDIIHNAGDYEFDDDTINQRITVKEYYARRHGYRLQHPNSFGLRFGPGGKIVVPAEVCIIERGQIYKKVLPSEMANEMLLFSAVSPQRRITDIVDAVRGNFLSYHNSDFVSEVGMRVSRHPLEVPGRLLTPPQIKYKSNTANMRDDQPGVWNLVNQRFHHAGDPSTWAVVDFSGMLENAVGRFVQELRGACVAAGMKVNPAFRILRGNPHSVTRSLEAASRPARPNEHKPNLLLIVVPDNAASVIRDIKVWGDCTVGMCTQCVKRGKAQTARNQYHNNVALKINVKLGGVNSIPDSDVAVGLRNMPTMIVGADVGHPGPGVQDRPSITSVVASTDPYMSRYSAYVRIQSPRVEIIEHLEEMILEAMENFTSINQEKLPRRIIFFRDGVSEGEYDAVHRDEIPAIYRAWTSLLKIKEKKDALVLTFIVVGKRHHIRFFPTERPDPTATDRSGNVHGGLVVDQGISTPTALDFYLQSHSGLKGTSRSGHYVVLLNEIKLTMDQLQELCYFLCFVYARATRAVSIPAPVYYADLVCTRARLYVKEDLAFSESGSDSQEPINIDQEWVNRYFNPLHHSMSNTMFFM